MRTCLRCGACLPESEFAWSNKAAGERRNRCKPCHAAVTKEWRIANPEMRKAQKARYAARYPEKVREHSRHAATRARELHREELREYQRDWIKTPQAKASRRAWRQTPKGRATNRRGALQHSYGAEVKEWWSSLNEPRCFYCTEPATQIDHIVPVSRGGTHDLVNLVPACKPCNCRKGTKDALEFVERMVS